MVRPPLTDLAMLDASFPLPLELPFTTSDARAAGLSPGVLTSLVQSGLLRRLMKGVYVAAQVPDSRALRGRALALIAPPGTVISDWSAAWLWSGVDRFGGHEAPPTLDAFRFRGHDRLRNGLVASGQRWFLPSDVVPLEGHLRVTTPLRTAYDLGRNSPPIVALGGMDAMARVGGFDAAELVAGLGRFKGYRGVVRLRVVAAMVDPRAESPGESALRFRWHETPGLPPPELQVVVLGSNGVERFRLDLAIEELRFAAEYDGEAHHSSPEDRAHDAWRRGVLADPLDWHLEVFRRSDVFGIHETVTARLSQAFQQRRRTFWLPRSWNA